MGLFRHAKRPDKLRPLARFEKIDSLRHYIIEYAYILQSRSGQNKNMENKNLEIMEVSGIFAPTTNNNGVLLDPKRSGKMRNTDPYVPKELVQRFNVKKGQFIVAKAHQADGHPNPKVRFIETKNINTYKHEHIKEAGKNSLLPACRKSPSGLFRV